MPDSDRTSLGIYKNTRHLPSGWRDKAGTGSGNCAKQDAPQDADLRPAAPAKPRPHVNEKALADSKLPTFQKLSFEGVPDRVAVPVPPTARGNPVLRGFKTLG